MRRRDAAFGRLQLRQGRGCARGLAAGRCVPVAATRVASPERGGVAVGDGGVSLRVAFCARSRLPCVSVGAFCVRFTPTIRFYWEVLRSITPVSFPSSGKERRLAGCCVSIPRGSGSPFVCSHDFVRLSNFVGSLRACAFLYGNPDGVRRDAGNGVGDAAWVRFCAIILALQRFPRGERWGCAPQTAPKSLRLSGLSSFDSPQSTSYQTSQ